MDQLYTIHLTTYSNTWLWQLVVYDTGCELVTFNINLVNLSLVFNPPCCFRAEIVRQAFHEKLIAEDLVTVQQDNQVQIRNFEWAVRRLWLLVAKWR